MGDAAATPTLRGRLFCAAEAQTRVHAPLLLRRTPTRLWRATLHAQRWPRPSVTLKAHAATQGTHAPRAARGLARFGR
jgi:hypothetical protein